MKTINQQELINIYRTLYSKCTLFSDFHGTYTKVDYFLGHKPNLNKSQRTEIIHSMFSECNGIKVEINAIKITMRYLNTRKLNNACL